MIAKIVGNNVKNAPETFDQTVNMYVYEEMVDGRKLSEIINQDHENVKYLPGFKLPENVVSTHYTVLYSKKKEFKKFKTQ